MLHAIQAPERVTPTPPRVVRPTPVVPTPTVEGAAAETDASPTTPTTAIATQPEEPGPTFREFFFNHPGIRRTSPLSSILSPCSSKLTYSNRWNNRILHIPTYRFPTFGSPFLPLCSVWLLGSADLQECVERYDWGFRSYFHLWYQLGQAGSTSLYVPSLAQLSREGEEAEADSQIYSHVPIISFSSRLPHGYGSCHYG
jgi:hypothetical protein